MPTICSVKDCTVYYGDGETMTFRLFFGPAEIGCSVLEGGGAGGRQIVEARILVI